MLISKPAKTLFSKTVWTAYNTYRKGLQYHRRFAEMEERLNGSRESITAFQWERLQKLIKHAYQTTPYYRALLDSRQIRPEDIQYPPELAQIPMLEKPTIRKRLDELLSQAIPKHKRIKNATGGSSGTPLIFYQDRGYWNQRNLSVYYFDRWAGWDFGERQLIIWGSLADVERRVRLKQRLNRFWRNHRWLNGYNLTEEKMLDAFEQMRRWHPQTILAYASSLYHFANCLEQNQLSPDWGSKGIISSAEMLYPHYRKSAETVFKAKVYNRYGGREVGLVAMECSAGRMHINCDGLYLEIDSADPFTEPGEILITQLNNYAMPFIRYRIGDIGMLSDEVCPCGNQLPILGDLLGRTTATFRTRTGKFIHGGYFTQQFYGIESVNRFQLIQESYDLCHLKLVVNERFTDDTLAWIVGRIKDALGEGVEVQVNLVSEIPPLPSGKIAFTISKLADEDKG